MTYCDPSEAQAHALHVVGRQLGRGRTQGDEHVAQPAARGGIVEVGEQHPHVEHLTVPALGDGDASLRVDDDACVHRRRLGESEELVQYGARAVVAKSERILRGVGARVHTQHAGHNLGAQRDRSGCGTAA